MPGGTVNDEAYTVGLTFENTTINFAGKPLEEQLNNKDPKDHKHELIEDLPIVVTKIEEATANCVKTEGSYGNAKINGVFTCKDVRFTLDNVETQLTTELKKLQPQTSHTIQHLTLTADTNIKVGYPVFFTGEITGKTFTPITISSTDCVPIVKSTGDYNTFAGICTEVDTPYKGQTTKMYRGKEHAFIKFATHGDFQMYVEDSSKYKIGDLITYDGKIIDPEETMTYKTMMSIVGNVSAIVRNNSIAVFRK